MNRKWVPRLAFVIVWIPTVAIISRLCAATQVRQLCKGTQRSQNYQFTRIFASILGFFYSLSVACVVDYFLTSLWLWRWRHKRVDGEGRQRGVSTVSHISLYTLDLVCVECFDYAC